MHAASRLPVDIGARALHRDGMHTSTTAQPLRGLTVLNTRPVGGSAALTRAARALGARVLLLPGASLRPSPDPVAAAHALERARRAEAVVFVSPAAVRMAFRLRPVWRALRSTRVLAVGPATARDLQRRGVIALAPDARYDSEGVLAALAARPPATVAVIGAPGGRELIARELRARGSAVSEVHVYRRGPARLDRRHFAALAAARGRLVLLLSSSESLAHLQQSLPPASWRHLRAAGVVASSARVAAAARAAGLRDPQVAHSALTADLLQAAAFFARR
jgi:uroporphyrinogen-III synthase